MTETYDEIRASVRALCSRFPDPYWRQLDLERAYPDAFVHALTEAGFLAALIPPEYGGSGLGLGAACAILEEVQRSGGNAATWGETSPAAPRSGPSIDWTVISSVAAPVLGYEVLAKLHG